MATANPTNDPSKNISLTLNSNNPFLNATRQPLPSPAALGPQSAPIQHKSNNPFLAAFETDLSTSPPKHMNSRRDASPSRPVIEEDAKELFKRLTINDKASESKTSSDSPRRKPAKPEVQYKRGPNGLKIPIRPPPAGSRRDDERRRRNSDSSTVERPVREERRRREREGSRDGKKERRSKRNVHVDVVDKLDVTGLYGVGGMWHHDGPFDACRPQRNHKKNVFAPMNAFPQGSANNTIGGSGPVNPTINLDQFHGVGREGFHDYANTAPGPPQPKPFQAMATALVNPINRVEPVHGEETMGLGTSTFLEGAPASKSAIQQKQAEGNDGSLSRKKSIAMRLRGMSGSKRYLDGYPGPASPSAKSPPLVPNGLATSKGRFQERSGGVSLTDSAVDSPRGNEVNPFDRLEPVDEKKVDGVKVNDNEIVETPSPGRDRALSSPRRGVLERRATLENNIDDASRPGFLQRVKSLKGSKRRGDRQPS